MRSYWDNLNILMYRREETEARMWNRAKEIERKIVRRAYWCREAREKEEKRRRKRLKKKKKREPIERKRKFRGKKKEKKR